MRDVGSWLKAGDPLKIEPALAPDAVRAMRRTVLAGAGELRQAARWWPGALATAAMLAAAVIGGISIGRALPARQAGDAGTASAATESGESERPRQVQFTTPGGTHIVWVFDSNFDL
jgi:hypothetical protein